MTEPATALRVILGDQLSRSIETLRDIDKAQDVVLMMEVTDEATYVRHHKQKIALILSAMRHFADELRAEGIRVAYVRLDDPGNTGSFTGELRRMVAQHRPRRIVVTEAGEWRVQQMLESWADAFGIPVEMREDKRFFASHAFFRSWAKGRSGLRMEFFYREMRRQTGFLMNGDEPEGGAWNFDAENRKPLKADAHVPERLRFQRDPITQEVMAIVEQRFGSHFGTLSSFNWPVTRAQALEALTHFIKECLPGFGDAQDAMKQGNGYLFHSLLSPALNIGLLLPDEVCKAAEGAYRSGKAPLNAVEGFIRQILGWREYVRGIYWMKMPDYADSNFFEAKRPLPSFFWTAETELNCIRQVVSETRDQAYAHHIQRLMVTGNFALLAGIDPREVEDWYLAVYADAFEWVELPNTHGMALFADGGLLASKPYAASGAYINRMSDYCKGCRFDPQGKPGREPCPLNALYWDFLMRNEKRLSRNPRMAMPYRTLAGWPAERKAQLAKQARSFLDHL